MALEFDEQDRAYFKSEMEQLLPQGPIDDPDEKYSLFYQSIEKFLRENLPNGPEAEEARKLIREEKSAFLTRGHYKDARGIRGADSRMGFIDDMKELILVLADWAYTRGTLYELYIKLRKLNSSKGYVKK